MTIKCNILVLEQFWGLFFGGGGVWGCLWGRPNDQVFNVVFSWSPIGKSEESSISLFKSFVNRESIKNITSGETIKKSSTFRPLLRGK